MCDFARADMAFSFKFLDDVKLSFFFNIHIFHVALLDMVNLNGNVLL